jgi:hypothetical protein
MDSRGERNPQLMFQKKRNPQINKQHVFRDRVETTDECSVKIEDCINICCDKKTNRRRCRRER